MSLVFQDPEYHLLSDMGNEMKLKVLNMRRKRQCSISEAIRLVRERDIEMVNRPKKKRGRIGPSKHRRRCEGSVFHSLSGVTSTRAWGKVK